MSAEWIRLLLVSDDPEQTRQIGTALDEQRRFQAHFETSSLSGASQRVRQLDPDVVLLDLVAVPQPEQAAHIEAIQAADGQPALLVLVAPADEDAGPRALEAGAQDYLPGDTTGYPMLGRALYYLAERQRYRRLHADTRMALMESETKYRSLFDSLDEGFCIIEMLFDAHEQPMDYRFLEVNRAFEEQTGIENAVGRRMKEIAPLHESFWFEMYGQVVLSGQPVRFESQASQLGRYYDVYAFRIGPMSDRRVGVIFNDIQARKRTERALRESEARFRAFVMASSDRVYRMNADWSEMVPLQNRNALVGSQNGDRLWLETWVHPDDQAHVQEEIQAAIRSKQIFELAHRVLRADGGIGWTMTRAVPLLDARGELVEWFGTASDITERILLEDQRAALLQREQLARQEAERSVTLQRLFLGTISHELRTPLASIKGYSSTLLATDVSFEQEDQRAFLEIIDTEADRLTELIDQLMDIVQIQAGAFRVTPEQTTLEDILAEAMPQLQTLASHHPLQVTLPPNLPPVWADRWRIGQVLTNLVGNAAKFSPPDTPIRVSALPLADAVQVCISDEGSGIPPSEHALVFEVFYQVLSERQRKPGSGLGLTICKALVEAHGGQIWIEDTPQPGTAIAFTLPIRPAASNLTR
jgi:signal transduction histidine kinase/DNA-binding NarL/FixJ family response regulator